MLRDANINNENIILRAAQYFVRKLCGFESSVGNWKDDILFGCEWQPQQVSFNHQVCSIGISSIHSVVVTEQVPPSSNEILMVSFHINVMICNGTAISKSANFPIITWNCHKEDKSPKNMGMLSKGISVHRTSFILSQTCIKYALKIGHSKNV